MARESGGDGLRVVFDPAIDEGAWPGPVGEQVAACGEAWLGPLGLIARLELELGLSGRHPSAAARAAELARQLAGQDGFWAASFEADPLATSSRLLADRDMLALWGWRGEAASARLEALWRATAAAPPGIPDRLGAVVAALGERAVDIAQVELRAPAASLPPLWRAALAQLGARGTDIAEVPLPAVAAPGDLGRAQSALAGGGPLVPTGDGHLALLRPHGPLAAADEVAASLAAMGSWGGVVLVGADAALDDALARHGLPRVGGESAAPASTAIVKLVIEAAFEPMDPAELHALVSLDPGPVPRGVARRLVRALCALPGRGAPAWREALEAGLAACDEERRPAIAARLALLLEPAARRGEAIAAGEVIRRLRAVSGWARGRAGEEPSLLDVAARAEATCALIERLGRAALTRLELRRLCDEPDAGAGAARAAEAGLAHVPRPGGVLGPADVIVWWGFSRDRAPAAPRLRLSQAERAALAASGVAPPDPGALMEAEAARWRRPLALASRALVLVCPRTDDAGERAFPHPLWDELTASMAEPAQAALLEVAELALPARAVRRRVSRRGLPAPAPRARAGAPIAPRDSESPSSLERLLGCSLSWTLHYRGRLEPGLSAGPGTPSPLLYGTLAHHVLAEVLGGGALPPGDAAARAEEVLARDLDRLCESLALPRHQVERAALRLAIVESARELGALIAELGASVRGTELTAAGALAGLTVQGTADLVLSDPDVVLDLKWGRRSSQRRLESGTALQLATYAELLRRGEPRPEVGYFILNRQELLGDGGSALPGARVPGTVRAGETWRAAEAAIAGRLAELARGELVAPGAGEEEVAAGIEGDRLVVAPGCEYCGLQVLCGRGGCA